MARIPPVREADADPASAALLAEIREEWGASWNVVHTIANSPAILRMFRAIHTSLEKTGLGRLDREVIDLQMAVTNGCHYCVPAHIKVARESGLAEDDIKAIVEGGECPTARCRLVQELTLRLVATRGKLEDGEFASFQERGITPRLMIEVIGEIAHCTLTNYTNRLAGTEPDAFLEGVSV